MKIKNWSKFQHFKDRKPPWVKLHRDILDDMEWHELSPVAAKVLVSLWLIASEHDGDLPDIRKLAFRMRMTEKAVESALSDLSHWLVQDDINVISKPGQDDSVETETETETERDTPDGVSTQVWSDFRKLRKTLKAPVTKSAVDGIRREADKAGWTMDDALRECCARGWRGFKAEWVSKGGYQPAVAGGLLPGAI